MATIVDRKNARGHIIGYQVKVRRKGEKAQSRTFTRLADAKRWARQIESEMDQGVFIDRTESEATTLYEALERYEREVTPRKKGAVQERKRLSAWMRDPLANRSLASIRGSDLASWRDKRLGTGVSPTTVRNDLSLISHLFNTAAKEWGMESLVNPIERIKLPVPAKARNRRLVGDEYVRLMAACEASLCVWLAPIVRLALETAMRQGEIMSLTWKQLDPHRPVAHLIDTKNGEARDVPLSPEACVVLNSLPRSIGGKVFPISAQVLDDHWRTAVKLAGIEDLRFHDLRHEATSHIFEKGLNPMEAAAVTGHKTLSMLKRYTHLKAEDLAKKL